MNSLRKVAPADRCLLTLVEKEVEALQTERREVENWLTQAESWAAHVGHWKATVGLPPQVRLFLYSKRCESLLIAPCWFTVTSITLVG